MTQHTVTAKYNTLLHGTPDQLHAILSAGNQLNAAELGALLSNIALRIDGLYEVAKLTARHVRRNKARLDDAHGFVDYD